ncbi:hypothetical protein ANCDUO_03188 [Ancylostoma duodenale]|uniref:Uncharacterized protein n=1 Tax=Ancylostoma duodenale TaxID=51022 RepID=A0A0C2GYA9_9BILA|nr:hypothetical protein ANCDUO_03188 [Ancylostoma duodenale]
MRGDEVMIECWIFGRYDVIPFLKVFRKMDSRGEPIRAIFVTILICWMGILIAVIENITALITQ